MKVIVSIFFVKTTSNNDLNTINNNATGINVITEAKIIEITPLPYYWIEGIRKNTKITARKPPRKAIMKIK